VRCAGRWTSRTKPARSALADRVAKEFGRIDVLVNNAAIYFDLDRAQQTLEYFNKVLAVNLTGVWIMSRAVERYMKRQRKGKIIHQSSTAAYLANVGPVDTTNPDRGDAVVQLQRRQERRRGSDEVHGRRLGPWGINVNAIAPGPTLSEATKRVVTRPDHHRARAAERASGRRSSRKD
jgi:NAD(P)-dependent dehydrogenase (short-subunit alcohol dehydrogenase family)